MQKVSQKGRLPVKQLKSMRKKLQVFMGIIELFLALLSYSIELPRTPPRNPPALPRTQPHNPPAFPRTPPHSPPHSPALPRTPPHSPELPGLPGNPEHMGGFSCTWPLRLGIPNVFFLIFAHATRLVFVLSWPVLQESSLFRAGLIDFYV